MSRTHSPSATRPYGLAQVCRIWRCGRSTVYRHRQAEARPSPLRRRPGPQGPMSDAALAERIFRLLADSPFHGEGYRKIWARLRYAGVRTSPRRVLRVLRGEDLELVSREIGTTAADLSRWRDSFLEAGAASLKTRPEDGRDRELKAMREKIGEMTMSNELLEAKIERLEAGAPFRLRRSKR